MVPGCPLWFGNQHAPDDINPTYGTARVLAAYRDARDQTNPAALRGVEWLKDNQNADWRLGRRFGDAFQRGRDGPRDGDSLVLGA